MLHAKIEAIQALFAQSAFNENSAFQVKIKGNRLLIPYRFDIRQSTPKCIQSALQTRATNGFIRQQGLLQLLRTPCDFNTPFIIQLLSEYVLDIHLACIKYCQQQHQAFTGFAHENPCYLAKSIQRSISYWNAYYRQRYAHYHLFPAYQLLRNMQEQSELSHCN
ncbi:hypothetical protein VQ643_00350 [Pseudomonas sp. F1_0610]|uniref:hypothetical protein n=1 Tax=Pseudomonas sp. F1_0610 TaxID=3114284 RepID=UPI0039C1B6E8